MVTFSCYLIQLHVMWDGLWTLTLKWLTCCLTIYIYCGLAIGKDIWKSSSIFFRFALGINCQSYSQNLIHYYVHIQALEEEYIAVCKYLEQGGFNGSLTGKLRSRIP